MRIAYVIDCIEGINGGTERQLYLLIKGMVARGHSVTLYVLRDTLFTKKLSEFVCPVMCLGMDHVVTLTGFRRLWRFRKELVKSKVDVVHGFFNDVAMSIPALMMWTGIRTYTSRRDMGIWYSRRKLFVLRLLGLTKTKIICNSLAVAALTRKKEWQPRRGIRVIYNGIEPAVKALDRDGLAMELEEHMAAGGINVAFVGNIRPIKRIEDLIGAARKLLRSLTPVHFYVIGDVENDVYFKSLEESVRCLSLGEVVKFVGAKEEPRRFLIHFDAGVLTSASEGLSNSIIEYLAAGLPVVVSRVGGNPELVSHGYNGFLYQLGNVEELADFLGRLAVDSELRRAMGNNARKSIDRFHSRGMVDRHEKLYMGD